MGFDVTTLSKPDTGGGLNSLKAVGIGSSEYRARKISEEGKWFFGRDAQRKA